MVNIIYTIIIIIIFTIGLLLISALNEVIARLIFKYLQIDRESIWSWVIVVIISFLLLLVILDIFKIEIHDILGISETVDIILTGEQEKIVGGEVIHYIDNKV